MAIARPVREPQHTGCAPAGYPAGAFIAMNKPTQEDAMAKKAKKAKKARKKK
jgi:hypothetical protein